MADCVAKGRKATGIRNGRYTHPERTPRGERQRFAKLTEDAVRDIRKSLAEGTATRYELAAKYGVTHSTISHACTGRQWAHVK